MGASLVTHNGSRDLVNALKKQLQDDLSAEQKRLASAYTRAAKDVAKANVGKLRSDMRATGFRNASSLAQTWRGNVYPINGNSLSPAVYIWSRAPEIVAAFDSGLTITQNGRRFFAIPVGPAIQIGREMSRAVNRARDTSGRFQNEASKVARVGRALGVRMWFEPTKRGGGVLVARIGGVNRVLFVLVRSFSPGKRMAGRALLQTMTASFPADFAAALERYL